jgi:hypothetical protein
MANLTLALGKTEIDIIDRMAARAGTGMSKTQLIKCALNLYHLIDVRQRAGYEFAFVKDGSYVPVVVVGPALMPWEDEELKEGGDAKAD